MRIERIKNPNTQCARERTRKRWQSTNSRSRKMNFIHLFYLFHLLFAHLLNFSFHPSSHVSLVALSPFPSRSSIHRKHEMSKFRLKFEWYTLQHSAIYHLICWIPSGVFSWWMCLSFVHQLMVRWLFRFYLLFLLLFWQAFCMHAWITVHSFHF